MYGKLFAQMYDGTLATKGPWQALATFQQLIILADKHGVVDMTAEAIARRTTFPLDVIHLGITELERPDPDSRTPGEEGRRIVRLSDNRPWGWRIVNHGHYRRIRSEEERREYHKLYQRDRRAKKAVNSDVNTSTTGQQNQPIAVSSKQDAVSKKQEKTITASDEAAISDVLEFDKQLHPRRKLAGEKQRSIVRRALRHFSAAELKEAIAGYASDAWHRDRGKHELSYVLRDVDKINTGRELYFKTKEAEEATAFARLLIESGTLDPTTPLTVVDSAAHEIEARGDMPAADFKAKRSTLDLHLCRRAEGRGAIERHVRERLFAANGAAR